ncbi:unnamed protein product, partial [Staurois parvus]
AVAHPHTVPRALYPLLILLQTHPLPCASLSSSPTLLLGGLFNIGLCMAFNLATLRFATLPWAPVPSSCCLPGPECVMGPCTPPIAADFIARLCHVPLSGLLTLLVGSIL